MAYQLPKEHTETVNLYFSPTYGPGLLFAGALPADSIAARGDVVVASQEVTFQIAPEADIVNGAVRALRAKQQTIRAEAEREALKIEEQIGSLLALEHTP